GTECRGLSDAIAVAVAILIEPESEPKSEPAVATNVATSVGDRASTPTEPSATTRKTKAAPPATTLDGGSASSTREPLPLAPDGRWYAYLFGGAMGTVWAPSQPAAGATLGVELSHRSGFGVSLNGLASWAMPAKKGDGRVTVRVLGGMTGLCWRRLLFAHTDYQICLDVGVGSMRAEARDYAVVYVATSHVPWVVVGPRFAVVQRLTPRTQAYFALGALANLRREQFVVEGNTGKVADAQPVGLLSELGIGFGGPIR
ncbi:MAG TPA: hypothetical protein VIV60_11005, partial [Polyangiaceae bacterium]